MDGELVLRESAGDLGLVLWRSLANVELWAETAPEARQGLFVEGAEERRREDLRALALDPRLDEPLGVIARLLGGPEALSPRTVAGACRAVSLWAEQERPGTALAFVQAAALADPADASAAYWAGHFARALGELPRAETWFRHAILRARRAREWRTLVLSQIGLGKVFLARGSLPAAERTMVRAQRAARRHSMHEQRAWTLHELAVIASSRERWEEAARFARAALEIYEADAALLHQVPRLVRDLAVVWIRRGLYRPALEVLWPVIDQLPAPVERLQGWANLARAAGGAGEAAAFEEAWTAALALLAQPRARDVAAEALLELSRGAAGLGLWPRARTAARQALSLAREQRQAKLDLEAESMLATLEGEHRAEAAVQRRARRTPGPVRHLADALVASADRARRAGADTPATR